MPERVALVRVGGYVLHIYIFGGVGMCVCSENEHHIFTSST